MKKIQPKHYTKYKKQICDWTDKKNYLIHYRLLKCYTTHGMVDEKVHGVTSFKQRKWLEKYLSFDTRKRNKAKKEFEKDFYELIRNGFFGKMLENI